MDLTPVSTEGHAYSHESDLFEGSSFPPLLSHKHYDAPSVFTPQNLLREARRQKGLAFGQVPSVCVLDPDGDLVDYLHATGRTREGSSLIPTG